MQPIPDVITYARAYPPFIRHLLIAAAVGLGLYCLFAAISALCAKDFLNALFPFLFAAALLFTAARAWLYGINNAFHLTPDTLVIDSPCRHRTIPLADIQDIFLKSDNDIQYLHVKDQHGKTHTLPDLFPTENEKQAFMDTLIRRWKQARAT